MEQNSTTVLPSHTLGSIRTPLYISYIVFGTPAVLANLAIILVVCSDKNLRRKSAFMVGLAGGNLCNGLHHFGYGIYRLPSFVAGTLELPANVWACMASMLPTCLVVGFALPATFQLVIGLERLVAVVAHNWYRVHWSHKRNWYAVAFVYLGTLAFWVVPLWCHVYWNASRQVTRECSSADIVPALLIRVLYCALIATGSSAVVFLLIAVLRGRGCWKKLSKSSDAVTLQELANFRAQLRFSRMMLVVALCELGLVVGPNTILLIRSYYPNFGGTILAVYGGIIYCVNALSNIFIYLGMNARFRRSAWKKLGSCKNLCALQCFRQNAVGNG